MKKIILIFACLLISLPLYAQTLDAPHNSSSRMTCDNCHKVHPSDNAAIGTRTGNDNLCRSCHNPTSTKDAEMHKHDDDTFENCTTCHSVHEQPQVANGSTYGKYIVTDIHTPNNGLKKVIFKGATGQNSFADGDSVYDGICEVCHTQTKYHRNDSTGNHTHYKGQDCIDCHPHATGFGMKANRLQCMDCHSVAQGPNGYRRQSTGANTGTIDFSMKSHHAYTGPNQSVTNADCQVCHDTSVHRTLTDGVSTGLKNVDTGASILYNGTPASMNSFCVSCHDSNGANGKLQPLSDAQTAVNIAFGTSWSNSAHNTHNVGCYGDGTNGCHANGHGSLKRVLLAPYNVAANLTDRSEEEEGFCLRCHTPISTQMGRGYNHMITAAGMAGRHSWNEATLGSSFSGTRRHAECPDCHNAHWSQPGVHTPGTNYLSNVIKGVTRIRATYSTTPNVSPTFVALSASDTTQGYEYELCFKCHSSWAYGSTMPVTSGGTTETDQSKEFNPNNLSYHPVVRVIGTNSYTIPTATNGNIQTMNAPWNTTSHKLMYCSDCHQSSVSTDPKGPHGSTNNYELIAEPTKALCLVCHKSSTYLSSSGKQGSRYNHSRSDHRNYSCRACHGGPTGSMHGNNARAAFMNGTNMTSYTRAPAAGGTSTCYPTCHGSESFTATAE